MPTPKDIIAAIPPGTIEKISAALDAKRKVDNFREVRDTARTLVEEFEKLEDKTLGKRRNATQFFTPADEFEPTKNKVVKTVDVIMAANLMAADFMVRVWPGYLVTKIRECVIATAAAAAGVSAGKKLVAAKVLAKTGGRLLAGAIGAILGAFFAAVTQDTEMRLLEKEIRRALAVRRKDLNTLPLAQDKKPSRVGPTYTRHP